MTGHKLSRAIQYTLGLLQLTPKQKATYYRIKDGEGGSYNPDDVDEELEIVNNFFLASDVESLLRLLRLYPLPVLDASTAHNIAMKKRYGVTLTEFKKARRGRK